MLEGSSEAGGGEWPDDLRPDDDDPPGPAGDPAGEGAGRRIRPGTLAAVALGAAVAGAGIGLGVHELSGPPSAAAASAARPSSLAPVPPGGTGQPAGNGVPPGGGRPGGTAMIFIVGKVTAVSGTSITIGGPGHSVSAAVTGSTKVSGRVSGIRGIEAGDQVSAQIAQSGRAARVVAIQDPAQAPPGGSLP